MKKIAILSSVLIVALAAALAAQGPAGGGGQGGGRGAGAPGGAGGGGGQRGPGGGRGAAAPATGPLADLTNKIVESWNKSDAAILNGVLTMDALWLDEDGHMFPAATWINRAMASPKKLTITNLRVHQNGDASGWSAFNYSMDETATPRGGTPTPNTMVGLASIVFEKVGADWKVTLLHVPVMGTAITAH